MTNFEKYYEKNFKQFSIKTILKFGFIFILFFNSKSYGKDMNDSKIVTTKDELKLALEAKSSEIIIEGDLAEKVRNGKKILKIGKFALAGLTCAIATIPITGGLSTAMLIPMAALTGYEIALIMAVAVVGAVLLLAIWKDYEEIGFTYNPTKLILRRKNS